MSDFDLIVLGGGSGGLAAAQRAVEYGARVALFEPARLGGTCVNVGCVPKKVMWNAAEIAAGLSVASDYGFDVELKGHDFGALQRSRDAYVERLNGIYASNLQKKGISHIAEAGCLTSANEVTGDGGSVCRASHIIISTGGKPKHPDIQGAEFGIDSDGFFELTELPARVAIVGSGYIAVELAGVLRALGSAVSVFLRKDSVLRSFDAMLSSELMQHMTASGIEIVTGATPASVVRDNKLTLHTEDAGSHGGFDTLIWAIGRQPNVTGIGLEAAGVKLSQRGYIDVDEFQNTSAQGVYAIGDVTGQAELTPVAIAAGRRLADRVFGGQSERKLSYDLIPTVIFSHPPIGTIGLAEHEARERYGDSVRTYESGFVGMFNAITTAKPRTAMKLVVTGEDEHVVGCHVIGAGADEMMQGFAVAMTLGARKRDFDDTIAIHPTSAEELVTIR